MTSIPGTATERYFNSTVVQLEASIDRGRRILRDNFNSTVVQLEVPFPGA